MRSFLCSFALLALTATSAWSQEKIAPQQVGGLIEWVYDYEGGKDIARETGKPLLVVFRCER